MEIVAVELGIVLAVEDRLQRGELGDLLGVEVGRLVEHQAVAVAQDIRGEPAVEAQAARAQNGGEARLDERLTRLEVLAGNGHAHPLGHRPHGGDVHRRVGSAHDEGTTLKQSGPGVAHRGGDAHAVVGLHGSLQCLGRVVHGGVALHINLSGSRPGHHHALQIVFLAEVADVLAQRFHHLPACEAGLHVAAVDATGVVAVEGRRHGAYLLQFVLHGHDVLALEHFGKERTLQRIGGIGVPSAEDDVGERRQGHDVPIGEALRAALARNADAIRLRHAADGFGQTLAGHQHAGDESGGNGAQTDGQDAEFARCGAYIALCHSVRNDIFKGKFTQFLSNEGKEVLKFSH